MPKESKEDILIVRNIDLECDVVDTDYGYSHAEYFMVKYDGTPFRIKPGETRKLPRYVAEHYAKHLSNHVLLKMEESTGRKGLMTNIVERPKVLSQIIVGVDSYYLGDEPELGEGAKAAALEQKYNKEEPAMDLGQVANPMMGNLTEEGKSIDDIIKQTGQEDKPEAIDKPEKDMTLREKLSVKTNKELMIECDRLGETITGRETKEQLIAKIEKMA